MRDRRLTPISAGAAGPTGGWRRRLAAAAVAAATFTVLQGVWLACVWGAAVGSSWLGPVVVAGLVLWHLARGSGSLAERREELWRLAVVGLAGTAVDSLQAGLGLLEFRGAPAPWLAPAWITALWLHLGVMLRTSLAPLRRHLGLAALLGALGAPFAYAAGVRLGAATFHPRPALSLVVLALLWAGALPAALLWLWRQPPAPLPAEETP